MFEKLHIFCLQQKMSMLYFFEILNSSSFCLYIQITDVLKQQPHKIIPCKFTIIINRSHIIYEYDWVREHYGSLEYISPFQTRAIDKRAKELETTSLDCPNEIQDFVFPINAEKQSPQAGSRDAVSTSLSTIYYCERSSLLVCHEYNSYYIDHTVLIMQRRLFLVRDNVH